MRRFAAATLATACMALGVPAVVTPVAAAGTAGCGARVVVTSSEGNYRLCADAMAGGQATYRVTTGYDSSGWEYSPYTVAPVLDLYQLFQAAGVSAANISQVKITGDSGAPVYLGGPDVQPPPPATFDDGANLPAVYTTSGDGGQAQFSYIRPTRYPGDYNGRDLRFSGVPGSLTIDVSQSGSQLSAEIEAPPTATVGKAAKLSVEVAPQVRGLSYHWDFGDGSAIETTSQPSVGHVYTTAGTWPASVQVTSTDSVGQSTPKDVQVGKAIRTPGKNPHHGGGHGNSKDPTIGPRHGKGTQVDGRPRRHGGQGQNGAGDNGGAGNGPAATVAPTGGAGTGAPSAPPGSATGNATSSPPPDAGFVAVDGIALTDPSVAAARRKAAAQRAARAPTAPEARPAVTADRVSAALLGCLAVVLLLGLGVFAEIRPTGRRRRRRGLHT